MYMVCLSVTGDERTVPRFADLLDMALKPVRSWRIKDLASVFGDKYQMADQCAD